MFRRDVLGCGGVGSDRIGSEGMFLGRAGWSGGAWDKTGSDIFGAPGELRVEPLKQSTAHRRPGRVRIR